MKKILFTLLFCFISLSFSSYSPNYLYEFTQNSELNDTLLYLTLIEYKVKHPKIVLAQAKLETGNYTSSLCTKGNNLFGLYNSRKKKFFTFEHWTHSIQAYKNMVEYKLKPGEDYYQFLIRIGYAENPNYVQMVKQIEQNLDL